MSIEFAEDQKNLKLDSERLKESTSKGCKVCNDTSNDRYYMNQKYKYCPHCGSLL